VTSSRPSRACDGWTPGPAGNSSANGPPTRASTSAASPWRCWATTMTRPPATCSSPAVAGRGGNGHRGGTGGRGAPVGAGLARTGLRAAPERDGDDGRRLRRGPGAGRASRRAGSPLRGLAGMPRGGAECPGDQPPEPSGAPRGRGPGRPGRPRRRDRRGRGPRPGSRRRGGDRVGPGRGGGPHALVGHLAGTTARGRPRAADGPAMVGWAMRRRPGFEAEEDSSSLALTDCVRRLVWAAGRLGSGRATRIELATAWPH
jgi:hypothetical protein